MPARLKKDYINELKKFKESGKHRLIGKTVTTIGLKKDKSEFPFEMSLSAWKSEQKTYFTSIIRDITELKASQNRIDKLYRLYATLSQINQSIVRIKSNKELFQTICSVCVKYGKFRMAWIGLIDQKTGNIKPVTYSGHEDGYLKKISMNIKESPSLDKPTIMAINKGEFTIIEDIEKDLNRSMA